ncbi:MAG: tetratricopeptide repeat protein [Cellvibrionaceae bacterium]|nr:tetratricopeptide repeat protein [Cellvibrionaceae bacterium]
MAEHLTDEEQLQLLKQGWQKHGKPLLLGIVVVLLAYFGWQLWSRYQQDYAQQASALYSALTELLAVPAHETPSEEALTTADSLIAQLQTDYPRSLYALNAVLQGAKVAVDTGDFERAITQLQWALDRGDQPTKKLVRLRLARVYLALENLDEALQHAAYTEDDGFSALFAEVRGDVLLAQGDAVAAKAAYEDAIDALPVNGGLQRLLLQVKLSDVADGATL